MTEVKTQNQPMAKGQIGNSTPPVSRPNQNASRPGFPKRPASGNRPQRPKKRMGDSPRNERDEEFEQRIVDLARVTRVMAGGKRMRFRACVALGNKKGKIGIGIAKGADVTFAVTKAVNKAKKKLIDVPIINDTIPHEIYQKLGAAKIVFKPARKGRGVIAGGVVRIILELAGIRNITSKILGTNNKVNNAKCVIEALNKLKKIEPRPETKKVEVVKAENDQVPEAKKEVK
jgi:small subunit ribosomal protein S5